MNIHEHILANKVKQTRDEDLVHCLKKYSDFKKGYQNINIVNKESVYDFIDLFNIYRSECANIYEKRKNSGQELIRSTMLEGFFQILFKDLIHLKMDGNDSIHIGSGNILSSFTFSPFSFKRAHLDLNFSSQLKDQDFVIGMKSKFIFKQEMNDRLIDFIVPFVIIECKTYIDKNMLETHINSCKDTKRIFPFCKYYVASEYIKMRTGNPEYSKLDNIYIFTQIKNSERENKMKKGLPIDIFKKSIVYDLFCEVKSHLECDWWDKESSLTAGKLLNLN